MKLTIGIKAYNEERCIEPCLASAVDAARQWQGDVILADSGSLDRTVEIARSFPVRIFQLANCEDRRCGAGAQLAFQHVESEYFYLLDGDMTIDAGFLKEAFKYLEENPSVAAVGGHVQEMNILNEEFVIRSKNQRKESHRKPGIVDRLDGGGLYRVNAIRQVGYFADRNLHAFEEFELASRLGHCGWKLARLDIVSVKHFGHPMTGYRLLQMRIRSGYLTGLGELLRGTINTPRLSFIFRNQDYLRHAGIVIFWWALLLLDVLLIPGALLKLLLLSAFIVFPIGWLTFRRRGFYLGFYSFLLSNCAAWGLIVGFCRRRVSPKIPLASVEISTNRKAIDGEHQSKAF